MTPNDFEALKTAIEILQTTVEGNAEMSAQVIGNLDRKITGLENRLDEIDLVHENLIGEIRQLNKNVEDLKDGQ